MNITSQQNSFRVIDSHTGGEPTRVIIDLDLPLEGSTLQDQLQVIRNEYDRYRRAIVNEPRGSEIMVGAFILPPCDPANHAAVVFFNNVGYLGMCGHGMIGVVETLRYLGRIQSGLIRIETVAGVVKAELMPDLSVRIQNVPSYRSKKSWPIVTKQFGTVLVDIAYGGNWFAMAKADIMNDPNVSMRSLYEMAIEIMDECKQTFPEVDHVELFGPPRNEKANSRNFVLCPGGMYDRSPCGTGTSAKLACLAQDGELLPGEIWVQEGHVGSTFEGAYQWYDSSGEKIIPTIRGKAYINGDSKIIISKDDPFAWGF